MKMTGMESDTRSGGKPVPDRYRSSGVFFAVRAASDDEGTVNQAGNQFRIANQL
jgi:hypothetical protein